MSRPTERSLAIGARIREAREALRLGVTEAAKNAGLTRACWYKLEKGENPGVQAETIERAAFALSTTAEALTGAEQRAPGVAGLAVEQVLDLLRVPGGERLAVVLNRAWRAKFHDDPKGAAARKFLELLDAGRGGQIVEQVEREWAAMDVDRRYGGEGG